MSWCIAFFEYWLAVPANRIGSDAYSAAELKTIQEVITLLVFAGFSVLHLRSRSAGITPSVSRSSPLAPSSSSRAGVEGMALVVASGHPAVDRYLAEGFDAVRGMSSRFATAICGHLMRRQTELGIKGSIAEIGTFEGRFFIALALALAEGERAYGFDTFDWPDTGVQERFVANCRSSGVDLTRIEAVKRDSRQMNARELKDLLGPDPVRFFHIDGDHGLESLAHDLALAHAVLHPQGVICTDDMLHPEYPFLVLAVHDYLRAHPEMRLLCVIDREDIVAAAKFLICRADAVALYEEDLMASFRPVQYLMGGDALGHLCVVLTPSPRIFSVG